MKRWYNIDLKNDDAIMALRLYLRAHGIKYETSGNYNMTHFEIYCDSITAALIDNYIQKYT